jgi:hypothetical protein
MGSHFGGIMVRDHKQFAKQEAVFGVDEQGQRKKAEKKHNQTADGKTHPQNDGCICDHSESLRYRSYF